VAASSRASLRALASIGRLIVLTRAARAIRRGSGDPLLEPAAADLRAVLDAAGASRLREIGLG